MFNFYNRTIIIHFTDNQNIIIDSASANVDFWNEYTIFYKKLKYEYREYYFKTSEISSFIILKSRY